MKQVARALNPPVAPNDSSPNPDPDPGPSPANVPAADSLGTLFEAVGDLIPAPADVSQSGNHPITPPPAPPLAPAQGLRRNPPVTIEEWPDIDAGATSDMSDTHEEPLGLNRDPDFIETMVPPHFDPRDEPLMTDNDIIQLLQEEYGDLDDKEWIDMYTRTITPRDRKILQFLATRLRTHFSRQTYDDLRHGACEELNIPSEFVAWRRLRILSGLETRAYDCCVNSCCCFLGKYQDLTLCPFPGCGEARFKSDGTARRVFRYTPLIPQLRSLFQDPEMSKKLGYRVLAEEKHEPGKILDVFDSEHYCSLRETVLDPEHEYHFFDDPQDIALGIATDGFTLFKRRRRGHSTAWPIIIINYNLHPRIRNRLENVLCVGVIPGPKQCKDLNSFLVPLLDELLELESGVECPVSPAPDREGYNFVFRAFVILIFGDIPAVTKMLMMKGHNARRPCRRCMISGVLCQLERNSVYYVPLADPNMDATVTYEDLELRTHQGFLHQLREIEAAPTEVARKQLAQNYGLNARSIFTHLRSIDLAICAPYDAMHLFFENLVPNMIRHWTGQFKGLDEGSGNYNLLPQQWTDIGRLTAQVARTVPSAFVGTLADIAQDGYLYKAEAYAFWIQSVAPIVLKDRLPEDYYQHFLLMRDIIVLCLQLEVSYEELDKLQRMVNEWVADYEMLYYQYKQSRLPACPLTIHALIHLPSYIRQTGPLWASWAFVMERFCGHLLPAVKNRTRPYEHLDNYVQRRAQMQVVSCLYGLPSLAKPRINYSYLQDERISSREKVYPDFPTVVLGVPMNKVQLDDRLRNQMAKYFGVVYSDRRYSTTELRSRIDPSTLFRYGRFRLAGDGDLIRTEKCIRNEPLARDNSFVRYDLLPDRNAAFRNRPDVPFRQTHYGRVLDIYYVEFVTQKPQNA
ncbi:Transposase family Tnp2 protein [Ceratobasidium theobromae]|uniref:Transposase family Tnp2 protein n=1 Tax=Ceratobasidium theobromae TaxID=1582974 RepID=A0A5N5Q909_9AGAM|nr:Transposase family Tnp2 protein [Ceratobasidium theobromae]